jgi:hypothetical protein
MIARYRLRALFEDSSKLEFSVAIDDRRSLSLMAREAWSNINARKIEHAPEVGGFEPVLQRSR